MFQKVNAKKKVFIVLVRTPEDLDKCDALVIPGGGELPDFLVDDCTLIARPL